MRTATRCVFASLAMTALVGATSSAAFADDTVNQSITAGVRSAAVANLSLDPVSYSHTDRVQTGTMTLTADDSSGSDAGWNVTIQSSAFSRAGGGSIPAINMAIGTPATPVATAGQAVDGTDGPIVGVGGTLDAARKVISANTGFGKGTYTQDLPVSLTIPGQSLVGDYTATLTVTISAGPGA